MGCREVGLLTWIILEIKKLKGRELLSFRIGLLWGTPTAASCAEAKFVISVTDRKGSSNGMAYESLAVGR